MDTVLDLRHLNVRIPVTDGVLHPVRDVTLHVAKGRTLCLVGESGCGKSMTLMAIVGLLPKRAQREAEVLALQGQSLQGLSTRALEDIRGRGIGVIFQDPMTAFNPTLTLGKQLEEVHIRHCRQGRAAARARALELMRRVGIPSPESRLRQYPHELSGGLRQRMMIAMALMCEPVLLLADEPTTALDVTVQAQVLGLLKRLCGELGIAVVLITHDLGVVAAVADDIAVMYAGEVVETGTVREVFSAPTHPYTEALFACVPKALAEGQAARRDDASPRRLGNIPGRVPSLVNLAPGCAFANRCAHAVGECSRGPIALRPFQDADGASSARALRCLLPHRHPTATTQQQGLPA